ncbi:MAG: nicotinamidase [Halorhodospira halophila]|uniref:isochorismatase family protein n=1 Tax=Halorhodospira TaxID=85108 RepID=UPI001913AD5D|nr:nicotinamidase [Halorhodospira halophila]MCG5532817.1 nicotinamidase [Halorhodospira sp. 9621]MCG5537004.1 nicotinamidase [Halorhodospira sp. 9622]MCG5542305.1 nicotinamidase [Halorhodospira sp. 9628]MBK5936202.1 nicotinamidase [Halorhodospira halophila]MBK5944061.1 nicotinamidase [Halorhodospira halophila]
MVEAQPRDAEHAALLVVDVQPDFMPGGALPTQGGEEVVAPIARLLERAPVRYVVATQDWHPPGHISFASSHPGCSPFEVIELHGVEQVLWPDHCVQDTPGAALHDGIPWRYADLVLRKATDPLVDSYSAFRENFAPDGRRPSTGLAGYLRELGVEQIYVCGLARDYCALWSAEDGARAGFRVHFLWDLTRPVDASNDASVQRTLQAAGVEVVSGAP